MNDETNQDPQPQEFKLPTKPIGKYGAQVLAIVPTDLDSAYRMSKMLIASGMAPYHIKTPEMGAIIMMHGMEVGMKPMMSVRRIAIIKGSPTIWGDAVPGLCLATGDVEDWREWVDGEGNNKTWYCEVKRKGIKSPKVASFSIAQAKRADLWDERVRVTKRGKNGTYEADNDSPWYRYPERMMTMRTRVAFRDLFGDVFNGLYITEELIDKNVELDESGMRDVTPAKEGWKSVDNPMGDDPKPVDVERKNGRGRPTAQDEGSFGSKGEGDRPAEPVNADPQDHDQETGEVRDREAEEEQEGREALNQTDEPTFEDAIAAGDAAIAPEKAQEPSKPAQATQAAPKAENAPAKPQDAPTTKPLSELKAAGYFQDAMALVANSVDPNKLNSWWRQERQNRREGCTATELEQLNDAYGTKFVALAAKE